MARIVRREVRKRGFFGWLFLLVFLGFNALMVYFLARFIGLVSALPGTAEQAGGGIAIGLLLIVWVCGSVITGLLALLTRGQRSYIEEYE
jgi:hypothetical protein